MTIVDYGVGNIGALTNMLEHLGFESFSSDNPSEIARADKIILPGVGAFDAAMKNLRDPALLDALSTAALDRKRPILGICLGMQLLTESSEEGSEMGLGWIRGSTRRIPATVPELKVPHIGWASIDIAKPTSLFSNGPSSERFYFAHSFHVECQNPGDVLATTEYGGKICVAVERENIFGVQFHPEKSHRFGMRLLSSFAKM